MKEHIAFLKQINKTTINVPTVYFKFFKNAKAAIFAAYLLKRLTVSQVNELSITDSEVMQDTALSENEIRGIKSIFKARYDFISVSKKGIPAVTTYSIDWDKKIKAFSEYLKRELQC